MYGGDDERDDVLAVVAGCRGRLSWPAVVAGCRGRLSWPAVVRSAEVSAAMSTRRRKRPGAEAGSGRSRDIGSSKGNDERDEVPAAVLAAVRSAEVSTATLTRRR